jgi:long-chain fatty acid transport protein
MKSFKLIVAMLLVSFSFAQMGHVLNGAGAANFSMGGAAVANPIDISGALQWNPASISKFKTTKFAFDLAYFMVDAELSSTLPQHYPTSKNMAENLNPNPMNLSGTTKSDAGANFLPTFAVVHGKKDCKVTWGAYAFGISGFGVDYEQEKNLPKIMDENRDIVMNTNFNQNKSTNPILYPQYLKGFGDLFSNYQLMQMGLSVAYDILPNLAIGLNANLNYAMMEVHPLPVAAPNPTKGYPVGEEATALGYGYAFGVLYTHESGFSAGVSYKTTVEFDNFEFDGKYLDESEAPVTSFEMNYPAILAIGLGYSNDLVDVAVDYKMIDYENTDGFKEVGFNNMAAVKGFGWKNVTSYAIGVQYKGFKGIPLRVGYSHNNSPIDEENMFFSVAAPAVVENTVDFGVGYDFNKNVSLNLAWHMGLANEVEGAMYNPQAINQYNPTGKMGAGTNPTNNQAFKSTKVSSKMGTNVLLLGLTYEL